MQPAMNMNTSQRHERSRHTGADAFVPKHFAVPFSEGATTHYGRGACDKRLHPVQPCPP
jgi:hypothetical protein